MNDRMLEVMRELAAAQARCERLGAIVQRIADAKPEDTLGSLTVTYADGQSFWLHNAAAVEDLGPASPGPAGEGGGDAKRSA